MMNTTMNKYAMALTLGAVLGLGVTADAQRLRNQDQNTTQQDYTQNYGRGRGRNGGGYNSGFNGGGNNYGGNNFGGGRNRRFNPNSAGIQVAEGDYTVIATKSIFLRDRRDRTAPEGPVRVDPSTLPPEQLLVVTGIVFEQNGFHAFVEHLLQGGITSLKVGDTIKEGNREVGEVTEIRIDGLKFKKAGSTEEGFAGVSYNLMGTRIDSIQGERLRLQSLTGGSVGSGGGFGQRQFGGGGNPGGGGGGNPGGRQLLPAVTPAPLDPNSTLTIEERMRMRRMQEGQPGAQQVIVAEPEPAPPEANAAAEAPQAAPAAQGASVNVDSLTNLTVEERMRLRRAQESGQ